MTILRRLSTGKRVVLVVALLILAVGARYRLAQLDSRFFGVVRLEFAQSDGSTRYPIPIPRFSWPALKGLSLYLIGDYARAARAYGDHRREFSEFGDIGDPMEAAMVRGQPVLARRLAEEALVRDKADPHALLTLGKLALDEGKPETALGFFKQVLSRYIDQFDALLLSSVAYARVGNYGKAIDSLKRALRHFRIEARRSSFLAALEMTGELADRPAGQRPLCLLAHYHRYLRIFDEANGAKAIAYARKAIEARDRPDDAYVTIGIVHYRQGRRQAALEPFLKAVEVNPENPDALLWASQMYGEMGDAPNEHRLTMAAADAGGGDPFYAGGVYRYLVRKLGDYNQALGYFERRLRAHPDSADDLERVGELYSLLGDQERAIEFLRRALSLQPESPQALEWLAHTLLLTGKLTEAREALEHVLKLEPYRPSAYTALAYVYVRERRDGDAIWALERAIALGETDIDQVFGLCNLYDKQRWYRGAVYCYRWVAKQDPGHVFARGLLQMAERRLVRQRERL